MKLFYLFFFFLHVAFATAGLLGGNDAKKPRSGLTGRTQLPQNAGFWIQGTHRPLFARRKKTYKRQKIEKKKPKAPLPSPTVRGVGGPPLGDCSQLTEGCSPQFGCCDPQALCHCRFFNAICFCRRFNRAH